MGTLIAQEIVNAVRADLVDPDSDAWSDDDLLGCLNEAIRATCAIKTDAFVVQEPVTLVAGTLQALPVAAIELFDVYENAPGARRVTLVDAELLDEVSRFWPAGARQTEVIHWTHDPRDKTRFRCYPPNDGNGSVVTSYGATPAPMQFADPLPIDDSYEPALKHRTFAAAYRRNTQRQDITKASWHTQQFTTLLGLSARGQAVASPEVATSQGEG